MVGKDEGLGDIDDEGLARVKLISDKKRQLEDTANQVRQEIRGCFERLSDALRGREKQLLRQVEAIHRQQLSLVQSSSELLPCCSTSSLGADLDAESLILEQLRDFGKIQLSNSIAVNDAEPYKAEEYIEAGEDFVSFDKSLKKESEEFDVSSVIRYSKRHGTASHGKTISINLNCTSCDSCKFETDGNSKIGVAAATTKKLDDSPTSPLVSPSCSSSSSSSASSSEKQSFAKESEEALSSGPASPADVAEAGEKASRNTENYYFGETHGCCNTANSPTVEQGDASKDDSKVTEDEAACAKAQDVKAKDGGDEHPIQIQQWLQQILAETETEPIIHEIGHISKIPNTRLYREFPVET